MPAYGHIVYAACYTVEDAYTSKKCSVGVAHLKEQRSRNDIVRQEADAEPGVDVPREYSEKNLNHGDGDPQRQCESAHQLLGCQGVVQNPEADQEKR